MHIWSLSVLWGLSTGPPAPNLFLQGEPWLTSVACKTSPLLDLGTQVPRSVWRFLKCAAYSDKGWGIQAPCPFYGWVMVWASVWDGTPLLTGCCLGSVLLCIIWGALGTRQHPLLPDSCLGLGPCMWDGATNESGPRRSGFLSCLCPSFVGGPDWFSVLSKVRLGPIGLCGNGWGLSGWARGFPPKGRETQSEGGGGPSLLFTLPGKLPGSWHLLTFGKCAAQAWSTGDRSPVFMDWRNDFCGWWHLGQSFTQEQYSLPLRSDNQLLPPGALCISRQDPAVHLGELTSVLWMLQKITWVLTRLHSCSLPPVSYPCPFALEIN